MRILVTGASGFAGSLLIPRLSSERHEVRALARDPQRVAEALARVPAGVEPTAPAPEVVRGDVISGAGLERALDGIEVAYYLIHSMERAGAEDSPFAERERIAAERFSLAAERAGVRRIVYLGGLVPRWDGQASGGDAGGGCGRWPATRERRSRHLESREEVERLLLEAVPDSVALRASIVIGARSRSFRLLVHLVERIPVLALPAWQEF